MVLFNNNFNANIVSNDNPFKSYKYKTKLIGNTVVDGVNEIFKNATIAVPLKYLSRSLEIQLINCKMELKLKWMNHCVLYANGNNNSDADPNNTIFTIKDTNLCVVPVVTLSAKDNQKLSKLLSKGFERSVYWNEYKIKKRE